MKSMILIAVAAALITLMPNEAEARGRGGRIPFRIPGISVPIEILLYRAPWGLPTEDGKELSICVLKSKSSNENLKYVLAENRCDTNEYLNFKDDFKDKLPVMRALGVWPQDLSDDPVLTEDEKAATSIIDPQQWRNLFVLAGIVALIKLLPNARNLLVRLRNRSADRPESTQALFIATTVAVAGLLRLSPNLKAKLDALPVIYNAQGGEFDHGHVIDAYKTLKTQPSKNTFAQLLRPLSEEQALKVVIIVHNLAHVDGPSPAETQYLNDLVDVAENLFNDGSETSSDLSQQPA